MFTRASFVAVAYLAVTLFADCVSLGQGISTNYDQIVDAFIQYDIGRLRGEPGQRAYTAFNQLNSEDAIPALVRGVNKAARIRNSCPIIVIAGKLSSLLQQTNNEEMLTFAIENLNGSGSGVYYGSYVQSMRQLADQRLAAVTGGKPKLGRELRGGTPSQLRRSRTPIEQWSIEDLEEALAQEQGAELVRILEELKRRKGSQYTEMLARAIGIVDEEMKPVARGLLAQRLIRMTDRTLLAKLKDENIEVRAAAASAVGYKGVPLLKELAMAVRDGSRMVSANAQAALVKLTGEDLGPAENPSLRERYMASQRWENYLTEREQADP